MANDGCLAIIPARGGSRGIPDKNIAPLGGRPLLAWTIAAARTAGSVSRTVVTTDSPRIAAVAEVQGAEVPFLRPAELATDETPGVLPIVHALEWLDAHEGYRPEWVLCLQPTSPFRTAQDIDAAGALAEAQRADAVVSVSAAAQHPLWMKQVLPGGRLADYLTSPAPATRRQDLPPVYALNGALYLARREMLLRTQSWYTERTYAYIMPPERSLDVDTPWDLYLADLLMKDRTDSHDRDRQP